jgi:hypothetical protein
LEPLLINYIKEKKNTRQESVTIDTWEEEEDDDLWDDETCLTDVKLNIQDVLASKRYIGKEDVEIEYPGCAGQQEAYYYW